MKTIKLSNNPLNLEKVLKLASKENIILKSLEGREFILAEVDDFDREIELVRQNQELMRFLDNRSKETKTFTSEQVRKQLKIK